MFLFHFYILIIIIRTIIFHCFLFISISCLFPLHSMHLIIVHFCQFKLIHNFFLKILIIIFLLPNHFHFVAFQFNGILFFHFLLYKITLSLKLTFYGVISVIIYKMDKELIFFLFFLRIISKRRNFRNVCNLFILR